MLERAKYIINETSNHELLLENKLVQVYMKDNL
jgi:hypothetical protein